MDPTDSTRSTEALLANADWVRRLARRLVSDSQRADDLAQEALLAGLSSTSPASQGPQAWLQTVVRNLVRQDLRGNAARRERERRAAKPEALPSTADSVARASMQRALMDHVLALDDVYRDVVLLRYFEGFKPGAIAKRLEIPPATVKTRLRRALIQLRERLDQEHGDDGRTWLASLTPLLIPLQSSTGTLLASTGTLLMGIKGTLALAAAGVAALVVGFMLVRSGKPDPTGVVSSAAPVPRVEIPVPGPTDSAASAPFEASEREAVSADGVETVHVPGKVLVVISDKATGQALEGAELFTASTEMWQELRSDLGNARYPDYESELRKRITPHRSDAFGRVFVPVSDVTVLAARWHNLYTLAYHFSDVTPEEQPLRLELSHDRTLRVQTLNPQGLPVSGVKVGVLVRGERQDYTEWNALTVGDEGIATMAHFDALIERELRPGRMVYAFLDIGLVRPVEVWIDPGDFPEEPIRLTLPETGQLTVHLQDSEGNPWSDKVFVEVYPWAQDPTAWNGQRRSNRVAFNSDGARAEFAHIQLGMQLQVVMSEPDTGFRVEKRIAGPVTPGELTEVTLQMVGNRHSIRGRFLDSEGKPVVRQPLKLSFDAQEATESISVSRVGTDTKGRFAIELVSAAPTLTLQGVELRSDDSRGSKAHATIGLLVTSLGQTLDLGDVRASLPPLVARGRVVDGEGNPIYWATVRTYVKKNSLGRPYTSDDGESVSWHGANDLQLQTDEEGRFEVRGSAPSADLSLGATKQGYLDNQRVEFVPGSRDITLVLLAQGTLTGSLILDEGIPGAWFTVEVEPKDAEARWWWNHYESFTPSAQVSDDGKFTVTGLWPGRSDLRVRIGADPEPVFQAKGVEILSGGECRDPRVQAIDLRGAVGLLEVEVVGFQGATPPDGAVGVRPAGTEQSFRFVALKEGRVRLLTRKGALDLAVYAYGYRASRLTNVREDVRVRLQRGISVRIQLPEDVYVATPPCRLELRAALADEEFEQVRVLGENGLSDSAFPSWKPHFSVPFDAAREGLLLLPEEGTYRLRWYLITGDGARTELRIATRDDCFLSVDQSSQSSSIVRGPDPESTRAKLEEECGNR